MRYSNPNQALDNYKTKLNIKIYKSISGAMHQSFASRFENSRLKTNQLTCKGK